MVERFRGRGLIMPILIVPLFISPVIVGQFWSLLLQQPFGPTNYLLSLLLGRPVEISWLTQTPWNFIAIITADVWQWTPFMFVILLSGLSAIAPELYEAARARRRHALAVVPPHHAAAAARRSSFWRSPSACSMRSSCSTSST